MQCLKWVQHIMNLENGYINVNKTLNIGFEKNQFLKRFIFMWMKSTLTVFRGTQKYLVIFWNVDFSSVPIEGQGGSL